MAELMKRIQCDPKLSTMVAAVSYTLLTVCSAGSLFYYHTGIVNNEFNHFQSLGYLIMVANGLAGFTEFFDEDSFYPLRDLLDYCQIVTMLPCYAAELWNKTGMGPPEVGYMHAGLGFLAAAMFIFTEYKRQDLTDLAIFSNTISVFYVGALSVNPMAVTAGLVFFFSYYFFKRSEGQCSMIPQDIFNVLMAFFSMLSLASMDDYTTKRIKNLLPITSGGEGD